jgi:hypothetical protein
MGVIQVNVWCEQVGLLDGVIHVNVWGEQVGMLYGGNTDYCVGCTGSGILCVIQVTLWGEHVGLFYGLIQGTVLGELMWFYRVVKVTVWDTNNLLVTSIEIIQNFNFSVLLVNNS